MFTIREYGDADAIRSYLTAGTRDAVVVGGGLLGLEAARFLQGPGVQSVTILEIMPRLLPRQLDETGSRLLQAVIERQGCTIRLGVEVAEFTGERAVRGLRLADGSELPVQTALISAGISPRVGIARDAGLAVRKGVIVDEHLCTSDPHIWAAGDLAEFHGVVWGIIPAAMDHAPVVAANILGRGPSVYHQTIPQNTLKVAGMTLTSFGTVTVDPAEEAAYDVVEKVDAALPRYEKYLLRDGLLTGCILLGSRDNYAFAARHIGKPTTRQDAAARLW